MAVSTIRKKGQTTIPREIRRHLSLKPGDRLEFLVEADGKVVLVPATVDIADLKGCLLPHREESRWRRWSRPSAKGLRTGEGHRYQCSPDISSRTIQSRP